ncbi:MAG TPA: hypothetical protein VHI73_06460 [Solirubrobacteraceae bacterium]|nr:hypothetical protein [Solirubrobacteraceae bacterium]
MTKLRKKLNKSLDRSRLQARYHLHRSLTNGASRRSLAREMPALDAVQERVVERLRADGLATVSFDELVGDRGLWRELSREVEAFAEEARRRVPPPGERAQEKEDYIIRGAALSSRPIPPRAPFLRYALCGRVLDVANAYLGLWSKLTYVDQWYTAPSPRDADRVASQRWHRDPEDCNIVKVFTYFSDVDADAGALEYVRGSAAGGRHADLWPWRIGRGGRYPPAPELEQRVPESERAMATGPAGTVVFVDTGGLHRGGFATKPRITSIFTYISPAVVAIERARRKFTVAEGDGAGLPDAARFALS